VTGTLTPLGCLSPFLNPVTNCAPDFDVWQGLRSPALIGMYPISLRDIWMHYAAMNVKSTRADGSPNPLAMPEPFEDACREYRRAVIISAMLATHPGIYEGYARKMATKLGTLPSLYRRCE